MDVRPVIVLLVALVTLVICSEDGSQLDKRESDEIQQNNAVADVLEGGDDDEKRGGGSRIFRYGRGGSIFRYGKRAPVFRYGKRGSVFRYGKREDDDWPVLDASEYEEPDKRRSVFRWGKRDDSDYKRVFRWGKRSDDELEADDIKRGVFRYGKRDELGSDLEDMLKAEMMGRHADEDIGLHKRPRIFRYGRSGMPEREVRANQPHVPFRFGE